MRVSGPSQARFDHYLTGAFKLEGVRDGPEMLNYILAPLGILMMILGALGLIWALRPPKGWRPPAWLRRPPSE